ncbi:MAG: DinB family protein [Actinomycetota bacterium]
MEQPSPEDKNWTWVLERPCDQCGYDASAPDRSDLGAMIRANAAMWRSLLGRGDLVAERPPVPAGQSPVWSALEYGCHVRDVYRVMGERLNLMLSKKEPTFPDWDQDRTAIEERYDQQEPSKVSYDLALTAGRVADTVDRIGDKQWDRRGYRSTGDAFTVESLVRYLLHDVVHHVHDVEEGYRLLAPDEEDDGSDGDGPGGNGSSAGS